MAASVQSMYQYWKNFDLQALQKELDTTATELAARQDESDVARKRLVEQSRGFKKNTPEDLRKVVAPLLKSFQAEIDSLSKRSKNAEAAFLSVYKRFIDVPDPVPVLEHAQQLQKKAHKVSDLEIENKQLRETLDEYNNEFAEVKNQEVTIKALKEKVKEYEDKMEQNAQAKAKEKEKELQRQFAEKERHLQETRLSVAKELGEAEHKVNTLQRALDSTQSELFDLKAKYDEATSAKSDEMEMIMADLERANERAAAAEREAEQLRQQLASATQNLQQAEQMQQAPDMEQAIDILKRSSLEVELAAKDKEISQLVADVQRQQATINKLRDSSSTQLAKLEEELSAKNRAFKLLEEKMKNQEDYEEVKRELNILKSIEFSNSSEENSQSGDQPKAKSLEMLLLEKNRTLQTENTQMKVANKDLTGKSEGSEQEKEQSAEPSLTNTDAFASIIGQEIVSSQLRSSSQQPIENGLPATPSQPEPSPKSFTAPAAPVSAPTITNGGVLSEQEHLKALGITASKHHPHFNNGAPQVPPLREIMDGVALMNHQIHALSMSRGSSDSSNSQVLDTADVAQKIREILSSHNIGQRLFAKHVLGLSQGTVSELLSKPKHWDKLTEKGRESYRKMYAWACDDTNILALKAISPKKGSQPIMSNYRQEDAQTEERIAAILSEAQQQMHAKNNHEKSQVTNAMVASIYQQELAKMSQHSHTNHIHNLGRRPSDQQSQLTREMVMASQESTPRGRRPQTDSGNLSSEIVAKIYQEELEKLALAAQKSGNLAECTMYQQELARMAQAVQKQNGNRKDSEGSNKENDQNSENSSSRSGFVVKVEPEEQTMPEDLSVRAKTGSSSRSPSVSSDTPRDRTPSADGSVHPDGVRHAGSAFSLVRPRSTSTPGFDPIQYPLIALDGMSPLQRMQSIANSLMTKQGTSAQNTRPLKAVLPPITQEEFDRYSNLNTDDLVKKVKDTLSQYSISQRLFGENILGLSQGSVSDLLARPKPWHMLTQKGREPFIRMQIFLEDQESIPKLVANQYRIPPDKLLRSSGYSNASAYQLLVSREYDQNTEPGEIKATPPEMLMSHPPTPTTTATTAAAAAISSPPAPPTPIEHHQRQPPPHPLHHHPLPHHHPGLDVPIPTVQPSVYEIAAMTAELDTLAITSKVKEVLQYHNLGQKLFGEAILGLSQGSVSELLSKPKPWHMLSLKGREPFIKMHMWLNDLHNIEKLRLFQNEQRASKKRKLSSDEKSNDSFSTKKPRVFFTEEQKEALRMAYAHDPYPNQNTIESLANELGVTSKTIVNWFHNHRMRAKQQVHNGSASSTGSYLSPSMIKMEPDDLSNQSDSVASDSSSQAYKQPQNGENSQWMFPTFEPIPLGRRRESGLSNDSQNENKDSEKNGEKQDEENNEKNKKNEETEAEPSTAIKSSSRRKKSKPMRAYEGTQLDKLHQTTPPPSSPSETSIEHAQKTVELNGSKAEDKPEESSEIQENGITTDVNENDQNPIKNKIEKLQTSIQSEDIDWGDEIDREGNIQKLAANVSRDSEDEWEF